MRASVWYGAASSQPWFCQKPLKSLLMMVIPVSHLTFFIP